MVLVDAIYIHKSGAKTLLELFASTLIKNKDINNYLFLIDDRLRSDLLPFIPNHIIVSPNEKNRRYHYLEVLAKDEISSVFCLNNLPPPVLIKKQQVYIYFHNALLLSSKESNYGIVERVKFFAKGLYIRLKNNDRYHWLVQTGIIRKALNQHLKIRTKQISQMPFFGKVVLPPATARKKQFLYVADGVPQKNHQLLFKAWSFLAIELNSFPELVITVNITEFPQLGLEIDRLIAKGIKIINLGVCPYDKVLEIYNNAGYVIFPSLKESFGLPLVEAGQLGCNIITSDLPYVYEVIKPSAVFDPYNHQELAKLVHRLVNDELQMPLTEVIVEDKIFELIKLLNNKS